MTTSELSGWLANHTYHMKVNGKRVSDHVYIVGGAVRNHVMGLEPKDIDLVVDSLELGCDSAWVARQIESKVIATTDLSTNQYGVAILTIKGDYSPYGGESNFKNEVIEIANARKESYGDIGGKGYKPHTVAPATMIEDLERRDFTVNTLMWRLTDIFEIGLHASPVLDLLGHGLKDLKNGKLVTPLDPVKTFSDDPTRILRAIKFECKYPLGLHSDCVQAVKKTRYKLLDMPWDAVRKILIDDILKGNHPSHGLYCIKKWGLVEPLRDLFTNEPGFAVAFGRESKHFPALMNLKMELDFGWSFKHSLSVLSKTERIMFRENFKHDFELAERCANDIPRPPICQTDIFEKFGLQGKERAIVAKTARSILVTGVDCAQHGGLQKMTEEKLKKLILDE